VALGLIFVIVTVLTSMSGYFFPSAGITSAQGVGGMTSLFLVMAVTSLNGFHLGGRWQANACRR
jgi:hypothetical protein